MAHWLYLASSSKASPADTYRYAEHGFVWRSYYVATEHPQAVANVQHLAAGDTLYIGYRAKGGVRLLGRCTIECPDNRIDASPVFCTAPKDIEADMRSDGYKDDPVLKALVGIFVSAIEPLSGAIDLPAGGEQNSLVRMEHGILEKTVSSTQTAATTRQSRLPPSNANVSFPTRSPNDKPRSGLYVGVDVGGRPAKGFTLCFLEFGDGALKNITFDSIPYDHRSQMPPTVALRELVARGSLPAVARETWNAASSLSAIFQNKVANRQPQGVFVDSPTAFSRNTFGHGRATEKVSYRGVSFQCTPSVKCHRPHGGDWNWLLYGMVAYASLRGNEITKKAWEESLVEGMYQGFNSPSHRFHVRECFPTATVSVLREQANAAAEVIEILAPFSDDQRVHDEVDAVNKYLRCGVAAVKTRAALYDRVDSLVASLLALPQVMPTRFRESERGPREGVNWTGNPDDVGIEGRIAVLERHA